MAKLVVGILMGLVLGLYLDSATANGGTPILAQLEAAFKNLLQL